MVSSRRETLRESTVFNIADAVVMIVDDSAFSMQLSAAALRGFGVRPAHYCRTASEAIDILGAQVVDLLITNAELADMGGPDLVRWVRHSGPEFNAYVPIIMTATHVRRSLIAAVRDSGVNYLVTKPFSASMILERIIWVSREGREFLETGDYKGPDRRTAEPEPRDVGERRADMIRLLEERALKGQGATAADPGVTGAPL